MTSRLILGSIDRIVDPSPSGLLHFDPAELAFQPIATYLTALHGFTALLDLYKAGSSPPQPWAPDDVALFDAATCNSRLFWSPHEVIWPMLHNAWPTRITFTVYSAHEIPREAVLKLGVLEHYIYGLGQALLVNFVEGQKLLLRACYGRTPDWPPIWNFGRVIRNAMAHGGKIRIADSTDVTWRGLRYSAADNGRRIINVDIWPGDIFMLIKELEAALPNP